jgi:hypothetical protein
MLKVLSFPGNSECRSEIEVEPLVGSSLAGFLNFVECITSSYALFPPALVHQLTLLRSNKEVMFLTVIGCWGSFPKPDFASRLNVIVANMAGIPAPFIPVFLVGEAKRKTQTKGEGTEENPSSVGVEPQIIDSVTCVPRHVHSIHSESAGRNVCKYVISRIAGLRDQSHGPDVSPRPHKFDRRTSLTRLSSGYPRTR